MSGHSREWWLHESEHVLVVVLLAVVLLQAGQMGGNGVATGNDPVIIVPGQEAFTVYAGDTVKYPWMVVNRADRPVRVKTGLGMDWERPQNTSSMPGGVTALVVEPAYGETTALAPGDHKAYRYTFAAPDEPGRYMITLVAVGNGADVRETVVMRVVADDRPR